MTGVPRWADRARDECDLAILTMLDRGIPGSMIGHVLGVGENFACLLRARVMADLAASEAAP